MYAYAPGWSKMIAPDWPGGRLRKGDFPPTTLTADVLLTGARPLPGAIEVSFQLPDDQPAKLEAFDATGRRIGALEVGSLGGGIHTVSLSRRDGGAPGLFWIRLTRGSEARVKKVALH